MEHTAPCASSWSSVCRSWPCLTRPGRRPCSPCVPTTRQRCTSTCRTRRPVAITPRCSRRPWTRPPPARPVASCWCPAGRYRVTRTLTVWRAVRVIGYGATRPVFVLPERTPGFQSGLGVMVHFTNARPTRGGQGSPARVAFPPPGFVPPKDDVPDANQTTFYSSMMNVDFEIGEGNPAAVAVRFHVAQHGILSDIDFRIGSGLAGIIEVGNVGQTPAVPAAAASASWPTSTSPFWPYTLIDSVFEGQREAAIREHQTGLTVVRTTFRNVPVGISIDEGYSDNLWLKDARFERVAHGRDRLRPAAERPHPDRSGGRRLRRHAGLRARARERSDRRHAVGRLPRPAFQPRAVRPRERQHRPDRAGLRRRAAGLGCRRRCRRHCPRCRRWSSGSTCGRSA